MTDLSHTVAQTSKPSSTVAPPFTLGAAMRWDVVSRLLPPEPGDVLEIGCGQGAATWRLAERANNLTAIEPDKQSFERAVERLGSRARVMNIDDSELAPLEKFDTVCAFEVLEHISEDRAALNKWAARLRPGGTLVLSIPAHAKRLGPSDELVGHFRRYDRGQITELLNEIGFCDCREELYGFPAGYALETARNILARRMLARGARGQTLEDRTASSGRFFQPSNSIVAPAISAAGKGFALIQRLFPDMGPGLVVTAKLSA